MILILLASLMFTPITPCRIVDTRVVSATNMFVPGNAFIAFIASGDGERIGFKDRGIGTPIPFSFADQGGEPDGCGIPRDARAIAVTFTVIPLDRTAGHIVVWKHAVDYYTVFGGVPILVEPPDVATVAWNASDVVTTAHAVVETCTVSDAPFADCNEDFVVKSIARATHLVADVQGYWK